MHPADTDPPPERYAAARSSISTFQSQLILILITLVLISTATVGWIAYQTAGRLVIDDAVRAVGLAADARKEVLLDMARRQHGRAEAFVKSLERICPPSAQTATCLREELEDFFTHERAMAVRLTRPGRPPIIVGDRETERAVLPPFADGTPANLSVDSAGRPHYVIEAASPNRTVVRVEFDTLLLAAILSNRNGLGQSGESFLVDGEGRLITPVRQGEVGRPITSPAIQRCLAGRSKEMIDVDYRGIQVIHGLRYLPEFGGACVKAQMDRNEAFAPVIDLRNRIAGVSALFALFAIGCSLLLARAYARPIDRLTRRARALQQGDFDSPVPIEGPREVRTFAHTFATMARSINESLTRLHASEEERSRLLASEQAARREAEAAVRRLDESLSALQRSEAQQRLVTDALPALISYVDRDHYYRFTNLTYQTWFGEQPQSVVGRHVKDVLGEAAYHAILPHIEAALAGRQVTFESELTYRDGSARFIQATYIPDIAPDGAVRGFVGLVNDISAAKAAERQREHLVDQLEAERARLEAVLRQMPAGVLIAEAPSGRVLLANDQVRQIFRLPAPAAGHDDYTGDQGFHPDGRPYRPDEWPLARSIAHGEVVVAEEIECLRGDGSRAILSLTSAPIRDREGAIVAGVVTFSDVTDRKRAEAEMIKTSKLESIGVLAGGIAHDFNNILTAIVGNLYLIRLALGDNRDLLKKVGDTETAALRAQALTQQLLTFSKGGAPITRVASMIQLVREAATFILKGSNVRCEFRLPSDAWAVEIDEGQITQVIHNIVINAQQAMPEGGAITIHARNHTIGPEDDLPVKAGRYVAVSFTDHGVGIPKKYLARIFDPYFTTKAKGSGLGLATAYSIVKRHHGHLMVDSEPGVRTTVTLLLPASDRAPGAQDTRVGAPSAAAPGFGSVLFMDDEAPIRALASAMLPKLGYRAVCVADGQEAVERYRRDLAEGRRFDVVVLDLTVPGGLGGKETLLRLQEIDPEVTAVVSSGYSNDPVLARYADHGFAAMITKPYRGEHLRDVIASVLARRRSPSGRTDLVSGL